MSMWRTNAKLSAGFLIAAGLYQLSPVKAVCLKHCRSPAQFLSRHWRAGRTGALRIGLGHGAFCIGCCWFLMALLFVGGIMNLIWIGGLSALVLAEILSPNGKRIADGSGILMVLAGGALLLLA